MEYGLGRLAAPDLRDHDWLVREVVPRSLLTRKFWWGYGLPRLDQGSSPHCVAYSWSNFLIDSPTPHKLDRDPVWIYHEAQKVDEWPGEDYDGTSVRAGAKVLSNLGEFTEYRWAFTLNDVIDAVLERGPVVVGTNWYEEMFYPDSNNVIHIGGDIAGGHAWKIDGVNTELRFFRMKNSWGAYWGKGGFARISFDDVSRLLDEDGEACMAIER